jgi:hypothetical protein
MVRLHSSAPRRTRPETHWSLSLSSASKQIRALDHVDRSSRLEVDLVLEPRRFWRPIGTRGGSTTLGTHRSSDEEHCRRGTPDSHEGKAVLELWSGFMPQVVWSLRQQRALNAFVLGCVWRNPSSRRWMIDELAVRVLPGAVARSRTSSRSTPRVTATVRQKIALRPGSQRPRRIVHSPGAEAAARTFLAT